MAPPGRPLTLTLFLLACAVYAGSLGNGFHYDDFHAVVRNPYIRDLKRIPSYFRDPGAFSENPESAMYRPLLLATFAVDRYLFGERPAGYHAVNVVLHGLAVVAVPHLLVALGFAPAVAVTAGALFAVHPVQSEAVCYVSSRSEVLMGCLFLAACLAVLRFRQTTAPAALGVAMVAGAASLLAKSVAVVLPGAAALCDAFASGRRQLRRGVPVYLLLAALSAGYALVVREQAERALVGAPVRTAAAQLWTQTRALVYYAHLSALPVHLNVEHQFRTSGGGEPAVLAAALLLASAAAVAVGLRRRARWVAFAGGWWLLLLLPASAVPLIVLVNEHRLYTATLGFALAMAVGLRSLADRPRRRAAAVAGFAIGAYTCAFALLTWQRVAVWDGELTLWTDSARKAPQMLRPHLRSADALVAAGRPREAEAAFLRALALRPSHPATRNNLGRLYVAEGRLDEAQGQFQALLQASPDNVPARLNLAALLARRGAWAEARAQCDSVLRHGDTRGRAQALLGQIALAHEGDPRRALEQFDAAVAAGAGGDADVHVGRGVALRTLGRSDEAAAAYREALAVEPGRAEAWLNLGNLYAAAGAADQARAAYRKVIEGADPELVRRAEAGIGTLAGGAGQTPKE